MRETMKRDGREGGGTERERERETDRQTDRQRQRTDRQTDRESTDHGPIYT